MAPTCGLICQVTVVTEALVKVAVNCLVEHPLTLEPPGPTVTVMGLIVTGDDLQCCGKADQQALTSPLVVLATEDGAVYTAVFPDGLIVPTVADQITPLPTEQGEPPAVQVAVNVCVCASRSEAFGGASARVALDTVALPLPWICGVPGVLATTVTVRVSPPEETGTAALTTIEVGLLAPIVKAMAGSLSR